MKNYRNLLANENIFQSMSRKGTCLDNLMMENFFGLLKQKMYYGVEYTNLESLGQALEKCISYFNH